MSKFSETSFAKFDKFLAQQQPSLILLSEIDYIDQILSQCLIQNHLFIQFINLEIFL